MVIALRKSDPMNTLAFMLIALYLGRNTSCTCSRECNSILEGTPLVHVLAAENVTQSSSCSKGMIDSLERLQNQAMCSILKTNRPHALRRWDLNWDFWPWKTKDFLSDFNKVLRLLMTMIVPMSWRTDWSNVLAYVAKVSGIIWQ